MPVGMVKHEWLKEAILAFLQDAGNDHVKGVAFATICSHVQPTSTDWARHALGELVAAGDVFTTIDEEHFLCT